MKEELRLEDLLRFDHAKMENLQKLQTIQLQIKSANKQRGGAGAGAAAEESKSTLPGKLGGKPPGKPRTAQYDEDEQLDDAYENYFEN